MHADSLYKKDFELKVGQILQSAFALARSRYPEVFKTWVTISWRIGGLLPNSMMSSTVQRGGELDLLLNCMEDEFSTDTDGTEPDFSHHYQVILSEVWVGHMYEIMRLLKERKLMPDNRAFDTLAHCLRLVRIPLEKHEIPGDRKLLAPLLMKKYPPKEEATDIYEYSKDDPTRSHIMPTGVSHRGSVMWQVLDITSNESFWVERRSLAEQILAIFGDIKK